MNGMVADITVAVCVIAVAASGIFAWWLEHRPAGDEDTDADADKRKRDVK